jgi:Lon-like protease
MYPEPSTNEQERAESAAQMVSSQDTAVAAALTELGHDLSTYAEVTGVTPGGPSEGRLQVRDLILSVDRTPVDEVQDLLDALDGVRPGDTVALEVRRGRRTVPVRVTTEPAADDSDRAVLGVLVGTGYDFPFDVRIGIDEAIGGPSAGLVFALSVYDTLTPGALTAGRAVAGTGTITAEGLVGPISGIRQKIVGAEDAGAELFLVPPDNCPAALTADAEDIRLVRADTLRSAIDSLSTYAENPSADLPRCPS